MKQFLFLIIIASFTLKSAAQVDSIALELKSAEYDFLYQELFNFKSNSTFGGLDKDMKAPMLRSMANDILKLEIYSPQIFDLQSDLVRRAIALNPFISNYTVNSVAAYQLNNKLLLSGSSFSGNSVFSNQPFNHDPSKMNLQGINLFLEYKVSDKFRIGGGVQINQSPGY